MKKNYGRNIYIIHLIQLSSFCPDVRKRTHDGHWTLTADDE